MALMSISALIISAAKSLLPWLFVKLDVTSLVETPATVATAVSNNTCIFGTEVVMAMCRARVIRTRYIIGEGEGVGTVVSGVHCMSSSFQLKPALHLQLVLPSSEFILAAQAEHADEPAGE